MSASKSSLLPDFAKYIERQRVANDIGPPIGIVGVLLFTFGLSYFNYLNEYKSLIASKFCQPEMAVKLKLVKEGQFKNWMTGNHNLQNEVKALRELNHPNVVKMLHNETQQEISIMVMDLADCEPLDVYIERISQSNNVEVVLTDLDGSLQLVRGLEHIHSKGIVYFGARPKNIFVRRSASNQTTLKLANFELSTPAEETSKLPANIKEAFENDVEGIGKPSLWLSPESLALIFPQLREMYPDFFDAFYFGFHTDVYMMGCLLFYWFTKGGHPFRQVEVDRSMLSLENLMSGNATSLKRLAEVHFGYHLVRRMIVRDCNKRLKLDEVIRCLQHNHNLATLPDEPIIYSTPEQRDKISQAIIEILKKQLEVKEKALARAKQEVTQLKEQLRQSQSKESDYQKQVEYLEQHLEEVSQQILELNGMIEQLKEDKSSPLQCPICRSAQIDSRLNPCGHMVCAACVAKTSPHCPFARCAVISVQKCYFP